MRFYIQILMIIGAQSDCETYKKRKFHPEKLNQAMEYFDCTWESLDNTKYKEKEEEIAVSELHFGTGRAIRNDWGLWNNKSRLSQFFIQLGIFHPNDISSIMLTSWLRQLNGKKIELKNQIEHYKVYWEKQNEKKE